MQRFLPFAFLRLNRRMKQNETWTSPQAASKGFELATVLAGGESANHQANISPVRMLNRLLCAVPSRAHIFARFDQRLDRSTYGSNHLIYISLDQAFKSGAAQLVIKAI